MSWKVAEAKQNFSRLLREAHHEPQLIYRRDRLVAALVEPETFEEFRRWREERDRATLGERFAELRRICAEDDYDLPTSERRNRPNPFADVLDEVPG
jgi:PHD/YefM family antitoxin component YafN of YafNO toxin-antitoxin module